jgi:phosphoadenosine phosphosulfate reductase
MTVQLPNIPANIAKAISALCNQFPGQLVFTTSFGYEDQVVTDIICRNQLPVTLITLDTGRLFEETYKVFSRTIDTYKVSIDAFYPITSEIESMISNKGPFSFYESVENRKECCYIRKVEPLRRALSGRKVWITGLRAEQSSAREKLDAIQWDEGFNIIKYNPLHDWTLDQVKQHIKDNHVPYNVLHDRGFVSIGCAPCTRAIREGEDFRAGRWWWESNSKKECGLHTQGKQE